VVTLNLQQNYLVISVLEMMQRKKWSKIKTGTALLGNTPKGKPLA
jgi:hypothetical protein